MILSDLRYVFTRLRGIYTRDEARLWLYARHPQLGGARAMDVIASGRTGEVLTVIERLEASAVI